MDTFNKEGIGRYYVTERGSYPSVTTVLAATQDKAYLEEWRARIGEGEADRIVKESTDIGSALHENFEHFLNGAEIKAPETVEEKTAYRMFLQSRGKLSNLVDSVVAQETPVWSHAFRIAGRFDLLANTKHGLTLIDFKNTKRDKQRKDIDSYRLQLAFYRQMILETLGLEVESMLIFMVNREGFVKTFTFSPDETPRSELVGIRKAFFDKYGE